MSHPLLMLILWVCIALVAFLVFEATRRKPEQVQNEPKPEQLQEKPQRAQIETPAEDLHRGAAAILARTRRARVLAHPHHTVPKGTSFHVKRQPSRELVVVIRLHNESATDRIMAQFPPDGGAEAWEKRNRLQYGTAGTLGEMNALQ